MPSINKLRERNKAVLIIVPSYIPPLLPSLQSPWQCQANNKAFCEGWLVGGWGTFFEWEWDCRLLVVVLASNIGHSHNHTTIQPSPHACHNLGAWWVGQLGAPLGKYMDGDKPSPAPIHRAAPCNRPIIGNLAYNRQPVWWYAYNRPFTKCCRFSNLTLWPWLFSSIVDYGADDINWYGTNTSPAQPSNCQ